MTYRVIQWATGAMGKTCLRAIIDHPDCELVGLYVYSEGKAGRDAGEIARRPPTGVIASSNVEEILALQADVVVHAARLPDSYGEGDAELQAILRSGKSVLSINGHTYPQHWGGERLQAFESACVAGGVSFMGVGLNPGFVAEKIAVTATSICTRVEFDRDHRGRRLPGCPQPSLCIRETGLRRRSGDNRPQRSDMAAGGRAERHVQ